MSERQVKKIRKENPVEETKVKKKSKSDILTNSIIVVLIVAVLGLGSWAVYSKFASENATEQTGVVDESNVVTNDEQVQTPTIAEAAAEAGMTTEDYMAEYGLDSIENVTADTLMTDAISYMTLANYAKLSGMDVSEFREMNGIDESYSDDMTMEEISEAMMQAENQQAATEDEQTADTEETAQTQDDTAQTDETSETEE